MCSIFASLVPRRSSVGKPTNWGGGDGVSCAASAWGDPIRSTHPKSVHPVFNYKPVKAPVLLVLYGNY